MKGEDKLRVAIVLPSFDVGGTENMVAALAENIHKEKFEILVISLAYPKETHIQERIEASQVKIYYGMKGKQAVWKVFWGIYRTLSAFRPDLIHSNMYAYAFCVPYVLTHRIMLLHTVHNKPVNEFKNKYKSLIRCLYKNNKAVPVAISHTVEKEMKELYPGLKRIERVYNPVDTKRFRTERVIKKDKAISFICVARFMKQKNHNLLLEAFAKAKEEMKDISLVLVGDGELREELEAKSSILGIKNAVTFAGNVSNVEEYLAEADIFVLSSDYEGLPLSVLEAMAAGLPIISTEVGGLADIVTDNGILVRAGDRAALTEAMIELAGSRDKRFDFGKCSVCNAAQYDSETFIKQYEALYLKYGGGFR